MDESADRRSPPGASDTWSEHGYQEFADGVPGLIWIADAKAGQTHLNRAWSEFTGHAPREADAWLEDVHPEDRKAVRERRAAALRDRAPFASQFRLRRHDGEYRWMLDTAIPRFASDGEFDGLGGNCIDITERIRAEELADGADARLRFMMDGAGVGTWDWDLTTDEVAWSPNLEAIHGREPGSLGHTFDSLLREVHPDDRTRVGAAIRAALETGAEYHVEYRLDRPGREEKWIEGRGSVFCGADGRPARMTGICADITQRKHIDESLRAFANDLVEADRRKDEFLAMLSHELRNPLASMLHAAEVITRAASGETLDAAQIVRRQVQHMARLVEDLLDVSRISRGTIRLRRRLVRVAEPIERALEIVRSLMHERRHVLEVAMPSADVAINGDAPRLVQIFANLLHNAAKFTPREGRIALTAGVADDELTVTVADNGRGIPSERLAHVFEPFHQLHTPLNMREGGLGLGLALVKSLVELHGGSVTAASPGPGRGCVFTVRLPCVPSPAALVTSEPVPPELGVRARRVLVVDDNRDAAQCLATLLRRRGHEVRDANDGESALTIARAFAPDVALLDLGLTGIDGFEVGRRLRADIGSALVLVALTGYGSERDRQRTRELGFDHHLIKPIDFAAIEKILA